MNSSFFRRDLPDSFAALRQRVFAGEVFMAPARTAALELTARLVRALQEALETDEIRHAHRQWEAAALFQRLGTVRRAFYESEEYQAAVRAIMADAGCDAAQMALDPIKLRAVMPGGYRNPLAAPAYYAHRDTWYAQPQSLIVWWMPLDDLTAEETFEFYPQSFAQAVPNDSEIFDYTDWMRNGPALKIGWQSRTAGVTERYPRYTAEEYPAVAEGFAIGKGEQLIFAGAHLHRTMPQDLDRIRFSVDFRTVVPEDVSNGWQAPNVDNRSRGDALVDYLPPRA